MNFKDIAAARNRINGKTPSGRVFNWDGTLAPELNINIAFHGYQTLTPEERKVEKMRQMLAGDIERGLGNWPKQKTREEILEDVKRGFERLWKQPVFPQLEERYIVCGEPPSKCLANLRDYLPQVKRGPEELIADLCKEFSFIRQVEYTYPLLEPFSLPEIKVWYDLNGQGIGLASAKRLVIDYITNFFQNGRWLVKFNEAH